MATFQRDPGIVAYEAFSGLRNDVEPHRFGLSDLAVGTNIDIDESGGVARRTGRVLARGGASHSLWSDGTLALFVEGSSLKRLNTNYSDATLRTGLTAGQTMRYQQVNDRVYFSNGTETGVVQDGRVRSWGLPVPPLPAAQAVVGEMPAGSYQYTLVGLRNDGQQSGAPMAGVIALDAGAGIRFTLPAVNDPDLTAWGVYLSPPNGDALYLAALAAAGAHTVDYLNDTAELALPLDTQFMGPPPAGHMLGYFRGRMFVAVGDTIFYSEPGAYELFDLRHFISFDSRVTMIAPIEDRDNPGVFVATETSTGWIRGVDADSFAFVPGANYGAIPGAMAMVDGAMFADHAAGARMLPMWLSTEGLCIGMPGGTVQNLTRSKFKFTARGSGCALFKPDSTQFVAVTNH